MKLDVKDPPREFLTGGTSPVTIRDCALIELSANEQVTFRTASGAEFDVAAKDWGFYATPSLNGRVKRMGLRSALVANAEAKVFLLLVEPARHADFERYLSAQKMRVLAWLDGDDAAQQFQRGSA